MIELILVRHGETDNNKRGEYLGWLDAEMNEYGVKQAYSIKEKLLNIKIDAIYSSPLKRAGRTAEIINENYNLKVISCESLKEYNFGIWEGLTYREIIDRYSDDFDKWVNDRMYRIQQGESTQEVYERVTRFIDELISKNSEGKFLIVTHLGCIRNILVHLLGMKPDDIWRFKIKNGAINKIEIDQGYAFLTLLNG